MAEKYQVYVTKDYEPVFKAIGEEMLEPVAEFTLPRVRKLSEDEMIEAIQGMEAVFACDADPLTRRVLESADKLKVISRFGVGYDKVDMEAATELGIAVTVCPVHIVTVAEHAVFLMLSLAKQFPRIDAHVRAGGWRENLRTVEVDQKTVGIVGFGRIGPVSARLLGGWGVRRLVSDPYIPESKITDAGCEPASLDTILREADFITLHCALTEETRHLIGVDEIKKMKESAYLVNTARGQVVDSQALIAALKEGWIAGAGLDVFEQEPLAQDNPLLQAPNLLVTPHIAGWSSESVERIARTAFENGIRVLQGRKPIYAVNPEVCEHLAD